jgi:DNA-binding transcriptional MocR family regulator
VADGTLRAGDRLPSVRELAEAAGVNVKTARAVYGRLESEGLVHSEHGRGTFVAAGGRRRQAAAAERRELRRQIAELEAELVRRAPRRSESDPFSTPAPAAGARLATTEELAGIRDDLVRQLRELDVARAEVLQRLAELDSAEAREPAPAAVPDQERRSTLSLRGARVRWVGV